MPFDDDTNVYTLSNRCNANTGLVLADGGLYSIGEGFSLSQYPMELGEVRYVGRPIPTQEFEPIPHDAQHGRALKTHAQLDHFEHFLEQFAAFFSK